MSTANTSKCEGCGNVCKDQRIINNTGTPLNLNETSVDNYENNELPDLCFSSTSIVIPEST